MKKLSSKKWLAGIGLVLGAFVLTGCTQNFCSDLDRSNMAYPYEQGVTVYLSKNDYEALKSDTETQTLLAEEEAKGIAGQVFADNEDLYRFIPYKAELLDTGHSQIVFTSNKSSFLQTNIIDPANKSGYAIPDILYWAKLDQYVLEAAISMAHFGDITKVNDFASVPSTFISALKVSNEESTIDTSEGVWYINPFKGYDPANDAAKGTQSEIVTNSVLREFGNIKFSGYEEKTDKKGNLVASYPTWGFFDAWTKELQKDPANGAPLLASDFMVSYKKAVDSKVASIRSCIATQEAKFGHYGINSDWKVNIQKKTYGYAWKKGFLEGLLVYPVSWLVDTFSFGMDSALTGMGQIWAIVFVTLIVRTLLLALTFKTTMDSQKMQALAPEIQKIQNKYPNANTNQAEKQSMAAEQQALYKRNKINPFGQILVMIIQFPVFISVWAGMQGSAALATGEFANMRLSDTIQSILFNVKGQWYLNQTGWWTALVLFLLMAGTQIFSMILPRIIQKHKTKGVAKLSKNPAQDQQGKTMKMVSIIMIGFTIVMGFFLPSAMGVYWLISGLLSMIQTLIIQLVMANKAKKRG